MFVQLIFKKLKDLNDWKWHFPTLKFVVCFPFSKFVFLPANTSHTMAIMVAIVTSEICYQNHIRICFMWGGVGVGWKHQFPNQTSPGLISKIRWDTHTQANIGEINESCLITKLFHIRITFRPNFLPCHQFYNRWSLSVFIFYYCWIIAKERLNIRLMYRWGNLVMMNQGKWNGNIIILPKFLVSNILSVGCFFSIFICLVFCKASGRHYQKRSGEHACCCGCGNYRCRREW